MGGANLRIFQFNYVDKQVDKHIFNVEKLLENKSEIICIISLKESNLNIR